MTLFWCALTVAFDILVFPPAIRQVIASRYSSTEGTILTSELVDKEGGEAPEYDATLAYTYRVGAREYTGSRYRYGGWHWIDQPTAFGIVHSRPPGTKVPVFYDPVKPWNSVLSPGLTGDDLFQFAFLTPFNAAMLALWWLLGSHWWRMRWPPLAGGVKLIAQPGKMRARLTPHSPIAVTLGTIALLAFLSLFVVGFLLGGFHQKLRTMTVTWCLILSGGLVAGAWQTLKTRSGKYDLIIDRISGTLELPLTHGRKIRRRVPFGGVQGVRVATIRKPAGDEGQSIVTYAPTLEISGAESESERLVEWRNAGKAEQFVDWLRDLLPEKPFSPRYPQNREDP